MYISLIRYKKNDIVNIVDTIYAIYIYIYYIYIYIYTIVYCHHVIIAPPLRFIVNAYLNKHLTVFHNSSESSHSHV